MFSRFIVEGRKPIVTLPSGVVLLICVYMESYAVCTVPFVEIAPYGQAVVCTAGRKVQFFYAVNGVDEFLGFYAEHVPVV